MEERRGQKSTSSPPTKKTPETARVHQKGVAGRNPRRERTNTILFPFSHSEKKLKATRGGFRGGWKEEKEGEIRIRKI